MGKKLLGATARQGESASTDLYNSITSSAAKVKEDLMHLACRIHIKPLSEAMGVGTGGNHGSRISIAFLQEPTNFSLLYFLPIHLHTEGSRTAPFPKHFPSCPPYSLNFDYLCLASKLLLTAQM